jgi:hypothetical protein
VPEDERRYMDKEDREEDSRGDREAEIVQIKGT